MLMILRNLYNESKRHENRLIITNFKFVAEFKSGVLKEDEYGSKKHTEMFLQVNENLGKKAVVSRYNLLYLTTKENIDKILADEAAHKDDDTVEIAKIFSTRMSVSSKDQSSNICFMDMRGEKELAPEDSQRFEFLIFGGILGDHPPQDRGKELRENFANVRQLGTVQMTTDTALLVSREILEEGKPINTMSFTTDPQIPCDDSVRRYLDMALPLTTLTDSKFKGVSVASFRGPEATEDIQAF